MLVGAYNCITFFCLFVTLTLHLVSSVLTHLRYVHTDRGSSFIHQTSNAANAALDVDVPYVLDPLLQNVGDATLQRVA